MSEILGAKGPCPSSQVIAPVGSTVQFECSYSHNGNYLPFWNITDIKPIVSQNVPPNSGITVTLGGNNANGIAIAPNVINNVTFLIKSIVVIIVC